MSEPKSAVDSDKNESLSLKYRFARRSVLEGILTVLKVDIDIHTRRTRYAQLGRVRLPSLEMLDDLPDKVSESDLAKIMATAESYSGRLFDQQRTAYESLPLSLADMRVWIAKGATKDEVAEVAEDVLFALQDLRTAIVDKLGEK